MARTRIAKLGAKWQVALMKLPMHTSSMPVTGAEARRVLHAVKAGRALTNPAAKAFAAKVVAGLRGKHVGPKRVK